MDGCFGMRRADPDRPSAFRLLQVSPEEARRVICAPKEVVEEFQEEAWTRGLDRTVVGFPPWVCLAVGVGSCGGAGVGGGEVESGKTHTFCLNRFWEKELMNEVWFPKRWMDGLVNF